MGLAQRSLGVRYGSGRRVASSSRCVMERTDSGAVLARNGGERHWRYVIPAGVLVSHAGGSASDRRGRPDPPALRRGGLRRDGLDRRPMPRRTRGRLYAVHVRHHRMLRPVAGRARRSRRRRPAGSREAARQAGLAGCATFHLVSADDRHLAIRLDGGGPAYRHSESSVDGEHRALGSRTGVLAVGPGTRRASIAHAPDGGGSPHC